jgi:hypothetical protein
MDVIGVTIITAAFREYWSLLLNRQADFQEIARSSKGLVVTR